MFEVGVKEAGNQLTELEGRLNNIVDKYGKLELKVQVDGLKAFTTALENIGQSKGLDALQRRLDVLQVTLANTGMAGAKSMQEFEAAVKVNTSVADQYRKQIERMTEARDRFAKGSDNWNRLNASLVNYQGSKDVIAIFAQEQVALKNLSEAQARLSSEEKKTEATSSDLNSKIEQLSQSITTLSGKTFSVNMGNEFKTWAEQVQALVGQVKELVAQMEKLHSVQGQVSQQSGFSLNSGFSDWVQQQMDAAQRFISVNRDIEKALQTELKTTALTYSDFFRKGDKEEQYGLAALKKDILNAYGNISDESGLAKLREHIKEVNRLIQETEEKVANEKIAPYKGNMDLHVYEERLRLLKEIEKQAVGANQATSGDVYNQLKSRGIKIDEESVRVKNQAIQAQEKLNQVEAQQPKSPQGGLFDPQKFVTLQEAIDKIIGEINRLRQAFESVGNTKADSGIKQSSEELKTYEDRVKSLKKEIEDLQKRLNQTKEGIKTVASGQGTEATQNSNLDTLRAQMEKVTAALNTMESEYKRMQEGGGANDVLRQRIELIRQYLEHLQKVSTMDLSKVGSLRATDVMFNDQMLFGQMNKQMYSAKAVKEFTKMVDETLNAKKAADSLNEAFERMKQKMLGIGSSATGGMRGMSTMMESITTVGERNIQTLIKEKAHVERLIAVAEKSIKFGEGHDVLGMAGLRSQQRENLEYLENIRRAINYILENRNVPEWMRFLNTPGSLRIPLAGSDNDIALLGGHFNALTHSVTGTSQAMRQLDKDMRLDNSKEVQNRVKEQAQAMKNAERENKSWADSMDYAKTKANELRLAIDKLENIKSKGLAAGMDMSSLNEQIEILKRNLQTLYAMAGGAKIYGTAQNFVGSSDYRVPLATANSEALATQRALNEERRKGASATAQLTAEEQRLAAALKTTNTEMKGQSQVLSDIKSMAYQYLSIWGAQSFLHNIIEIGGQLENQRRSIAAILGQAAYANDLFAKIQTMSLKSPFSVLQLDQYTKQLAAFGFEYNELYEWTKRLADISAGTGTDFSRLTLAIGHVRSEMALTGYTLRQFAMANIPMLKKLSENLGVTTSEIRKMVREKKVSYEDVKKVLEDLTDENGMFYNMQEVISESVKSRFKNLSDAMAIMYGQMAEGTPGDALKEIAKALTEMAKRWRTLLPILTSAIGLWGLAKVSMLAYNRGVKASVLAIVQQSTSLKGLSASQVEAMVSSKALTREDLLMAVATKKLTVEQAELAAATLNVSRAQLTQLASMKKAQVGMKGVFMGAGKLASPWTAALLGFEAVLGVYSAYNAWVDDISQKVDTMIDNAKASAQELKKYLSDMGEAPTNEREMKEESEEMKTILKNAGLWTKEMEHQIGLTTDIRSEYNALVNTISTGAEQMAGMRHEAELLKESIKATSNEFGWSDVAEMVLSGMTSMSTPDFLANAANQRSGGWKALFDFLSNDDILQNAEQLEKSLGKFNVFFSGISEYKDDIQTAVDQLMMLHPFNENIQNLESLPLEEQLRKIAESEYWDEFVDLAEAANEDFSKVADKLKDNLDDVTEHFDEITTDDLPKLLDKWMAQFGLEGKDFQEWAKKHPELAAQMLTDLEKVLDEKGPTIASKIRAILFPGGLMNGNGEYVINPANGILNLLGTRKETPLEKQKREAEEEQKKINEANKTIGDDYVSKHLPELQKKNSKITSEWLAGYVDVTKKANDIEKNVTDTLKKKKEELESAKKMGRDTKDIEEEISKLETLKDYHGFKDKEDKKEEKKDPWAKRIKERIRILREASQAFKYWRDKVGSKSAWGRVSEEFGDVLSEIGLNEKNIENMKSFVQKLMDKTGLIKDDEKRLDAEKELSKIGNELDRSDFEKNTEDFVSQMSNEIDELTRKWEIFNSVVSSTGDRMLAARMTGIIPGATPADLKRTNVASFAGVDIDFEKVLGMSEKEIEDYVYSLDVIPEKVKAIQNGLKDWKKSQQELTKNDLQNYAKWLGTLVDLESKRKRTQEEYYRIVEETDRLVKAGKITKEEGRRRENTAITALNTQSKLDMAWYVNLYGNANAMAKKDFDKYYKVELDNLDEQFEAGLISLRSYTEQVEKLNKIAQEFSMNGFLGIKGGVGSYLSGGAAGLVSYYRSKEKEARTNFGGESDESKKWKERADSLEKMQKQAEQVVKVFQDLSSAADMLANMFDALGMESEANAFGDASGVLGGMAGGASSLAGLGPWGMAAGAAIGGITSIAQLHDKHNQRVIEALKRDVDALEANTEMLKKTRDATLGYDRGNVRRYLSSLYANGGNGAAGSAMKDFYTNGDGSGYAQELKNMQKMREDYISMYNEEEDKKKSSEEALLDYKQKIADLDLQILQFKETIANELFGLDIKGWADQIGDSLMTAFENGEDAAEAFKDTVEDIMRQVLRKMLSMGIIQPMMEKLQKRLFGENGHGGVFDVNNPEGTIDAAMKEVVSFFGDGGEGQQMIAATQTFYERWEDFMNSYGLSLSNESSSSLGGNIKGVTEETADLLASYVNAIRADVSINRVMIDEYFPQFLSALTAGNGSLRNIENHTAAIMRSNDSIKDSIGILQVDIHGLRTGVWKMPVG